MVRTATIGVSSRLPRARGVVRREWTRGALVVLLLLVLPALASARQPAADSPLTITLSTASETVDLSGSVSLVVTFRNRGAEPVILDRPDRIGEDLLERLEVRNQEGVVYRLLRYTKGGVPSRTDRQPLVLGANEAHEVPLVLRLTHEEHSDYRFMRVDRPDDTAPEQGLQTLPPGPYQLRARYRYETLEDGAERVVDIESHAVTVEFR